MKRYKGHFYKIIDNSAYVYSNIFDYLTGRISASLTFLYGDEIEEREKGRNNYEFRKKINEKKISK